MKRWLLDRPAPRRSSGLYLEPPPHSSPTEQVCRLTRLASSQEKKRLLISISRTVWFQSCFFRKFQRFFHPLLPPPASHTHKNWAFKSHSTFRAGQFNKGLLTRSLKTSDSPPALCFSNVISWALPPGHRLCFLRSSSRLFRFFSSYY